MPLGPLQAGDPTRVGGFRLTARLGAGAMGVVFLGVAEDPAVVELGPGLSGEAGRLVAVKLVHARIAALPDYRARFRREVAAARAVAGTCTARVLAADPEAARPWLAMEYVAGPSLAEVVELGGPLPAASVEALAVGLAEALVAMHAAGVVHRDLKPANVLVTAAGPKVIDFGMARPLPGAGEVTAAEVTRAGAMVGSPGFLAPEQADLGGRVGPAADVWAWALTVGFAATGRAPFGSGTAEALVYRSMYAAPDLAGVPERLLPVLWAALERDPGRRPAAGALLAGLVGDVVDPVSATVGVLDRLWSPGVVHGAVAGPGPSPWAVSGPGGGVGWETPVAIPAGPWPVGGGSGAGGRAGPAVAPGRRRSWWVAVAVVALLAAGLAGAGVTAVATRGGGGPAAGVGGSPTPVVASLAATSGAPAGVSLPASPGVVDRLAGRWAGTYRCGQGATALQLDVLSVVGAPGLVTAVFTFSAPPDNPGVQAGAYTMSGSFVGDQVVLDGEVWLSRPFGYLMVGLTGTYATSQGGVQQLTGRVRGERCGTFTLRKGG
ncbi:serine/threonine-protein kinase [Pseudofrankia inefficax]|uniref:Serine/threonine protein kinase n=1 Tax=Pseudofrankia inefficax (strain DSM 45817 / CECT 9037 / DDB 130130 / EuI1c) TaxID=298654 RepID=E3J2S5_PSEI1|nr:serine/threonine-protein kinase [Pseudofrankia inefficax]ADP81736.1 serine/threonine protein kinase [Pseudofrankia inefficax]